MENELSDGPSGKASRTKRHGTGFMPGCCRFQRGQLPTGTILVDEATTEPGQVAIYARVSSHDQKPDLDRQVSRLVSFAIEHNLSVSRISILGLALAEPFR
jgi:putative resolvase